MNVVKQEKMGYVRHVACVDGREMHTEFLMGKSEEKGHLEDVAYKMREH